jgi:hypothetical protein
MTHLQNTFLAHLASKFEKSTNMTFKKIFFEKNRKRCQKMQNFTLISNPLQKLQKNAPQKSYKQNKFDEHE